ncbi:DUF3732 domain-containing protein [Rhizobium ruizarguesonis]
MGSRFGTERHAAPGRTLRAPPLKSRRRLDQACLLPQGGDEKRLQEREKDEDQIAMQKVVRFLSTQARQAGLQVILIEHAYIEEDSEYVAAMKCRWTKALGIKARARDRSTHQLAVLPRIKTSCPYSPNNCSAHR